VDRHVKAAHPNDWDDWESGAGANANVTEERESGHGHGEYNTRHRHGAAARQQAAVETETIESHEVVQEDPPTLIAEAPGEQPVIMVPNRRETFQRSTMDIETVEDVQGLIDSGQLDVQDGDQIILVEADEDIERLVQAQNFDGHVSMHVSKTSSEKMTTIVESDGRRRSARGGKVIVEMPVSEARRGRRGVKQDEGLEVAEILSEMKTDAVSKPQSKAISSPSRRAQQNTAHEEEVDVEAEDVTIVQPETTRTTRGGRKVSPMKSPATVPMKSPATVPMPVSPPKMVSNKDKDKTAIRKRAAASPPPAPPAPPEASQGPSRRSARMSTGTTSKTRKHE